MTDTDEQIAALRARYADRLLILGHHYQRAEVVKHSDAKGDSLELARRAAEEKKAELIAFCGVRFMAESADILTSVDQAVYMPEPDAGCPMADKADGPDVVSAWETLQRWIPDGWVPVVYVNSSANIKALCGRWGGATCTSSNATRVFEWALAREKRILFLPDEHLGANTAADLGFSSSDIEVFDPALPDGGLDSTAASNARVIAWKGYCHVHTHFRPSHVENARAESPGAKIVVHPECTKSVVSLADDHGSTSHIIDYVAGQPAGTVVYVGTESNLVDRLALEHEGRIDVRPLSRSICPNMYMTRADGLLRLLQSWNIANRIVVDESTASGARLALERMLSI